jgi:hypothetical protein
MLYVRISNPFFAIPIELGVRPDVSHKQKLAGQHIKLSRAFLGASNPCFAHVANVSHVLVLLIRHHIPLEIHVSTVQNHYSVSKLYER